jgi:hypothetical protein
MPKVADIKAFCDRLVSKTASVYRPIVYAPKWAYGDTLKGLGYPLWASSYVDGAGTGSALYAKAGGDSSSRWGAYSGQVPAILQFTSSATIAGQTTCDANAYRGTIDQLKALVAPGRTDMSFETDQVPVAYPAKNPANPTWAGPAALGSARDLAHEARDNAKAANAGVAALKTQVATLGTALMAAINAVAAKDSVDEVALAHELSTAVAAAVLAGLPEDRDDITVAELTEAIRALVVPPVA